MKDGRKVWVIVYRIKDSIVELLALKPNPEPGLDYEYYVITGGIEQGEESSEAAYRETYEEIGIKPLSITSLNIAIKYVDRFSGKTLEEECFAVKIDQENITLNEEHIGYKWLSIDQFKNIIWWEDSRERLEDILLSFRKTAV